MKIVAIDPGRSTGVCIFNTATGEFTTQELDGRKQSKEYCGALVVEVLDEAMLVEPEFDVVLEDFVLRGGQAVDIVPEYIIGVVDGLTNWHTFKYMPGAHKAGNKAYHLKHIMRAHKQHIGAGHTTDALSLAIHHWKKIDTKAALKFLEGYRK